MPLRIRRPYLRPDLLLHRLREDRWGVESSLHGGLGELGDDTRACRLFAVMQPLLDGTHTSQMILKKTQASGFKKHEIVESLNALFAAGLVCDLGAGESGEASAAERAALRIWSTRSSLPRMILDRVIRTRFAVLDAWGLGHWLVAALAQFGVRQILLASATREPDELAHLRNTQLRVACEMGCELARDELDAALKTVGSWDVPKFVIFVGQDGPILLEGNDILVAGGIAFLAVSCLCGDWAIGPLILPRRTACLRCHGISDQGVSRNASSPDVPLGSVPFLMAIAASAACHAIEAVAHPDSHPLLNKVFAYELETLRQTERTLLRNPDCPSCARKNRVPQRVVISGIPTRSHGKYR